MTSELPVRRTPSELLKRGYSDDEIANIYELGRVFIENGELRRAEILMQGITEIAPDFHPAWLALAYVHIAHQDYDSALYAGRQAIRIQANSPEAILYLIVCLLATGDVGSAGTYLGEIGELIEGGLIDNPNLIRLYRAQLARYQYRER